MQRRMRSFTVGREERRRCRFEGVMSQMRILRSWCEVKTLVAVKAMDLTKPEEGLLWLKASTWV